MAVGHAPLIRAIFMSFQFGAFFLFSTVVYVVGALLIASGKLFKFANVGLILMAVADNVLLVYTRTMPSIFFPRIIPWSSHWLPVPGTVQIFFGQIILVPMCALLLYSSKST